MGLKFNPREREISRRPVNARKPARASVSANRQGRARENQGKNRVRGTHTHSQYIPQNIDVPFN